MQTAKVKVGELYALKRRGELVRFYCTEIVTRKSAQDNTRSEFFGTIVEDHKDGEKNTVINVNPADLLGPFAEQAELVERKEREDAERKEKADAREKQARVDRLALYEFVGVKPPVKLDDYRQLFRCSFGSVDISSEGKAAIIASVHALRKVGEKV